MNIYAPSRRRPFNRRFIFLIISSYFSLSLSLSLTSFSTFDSSTAISFLALFPVHIHATHILRRSHFFRQPPQFVFSVFINASWAFLEKNLSSLRYEKAFACINYIRSPSYQAYRD